MSFSIGIVGLPNVGKSTLFQALTKKQVEIAAYPFTTIEPNVAIVAVPDEKLQKLSQMIKPQKTTPTTIKFIDIAGLVRGAHQGRGLGNEFLSHIEQVDGLIEVVREFEDQNVAHVEGVINPKRDIEIIAEELKQKRIDKPILYVHNKNLPDNIKENLDSSLRSELKSNLNKISEKELDQIIKASYNLLGLITFYTIKGGQEVRALTIKKGTKIPAAGGQLHSDFEEKFIRAEVINIDDLIKSDSWQNARNKGLIRTEGKDYIVQNGDVIEFKI